MHVVVDYNNVDGHIRRNGVKYLAERIARCLGSNVLAGHRRLSLRLYDGWYRVQSLTQLAQTVSADIQNTFPITVSLPAGKGQTVTAIISAEMAFSLHCDPNNHIWHTYRPRSGQSNITCKRPASAGCTSSNCILAVLPQFFAQQKCPNPSCTITPQDLIVRNEQKLVDTMMSTDLISRHLSSPEELVIVSSDDDLWPIMRLLLQRGHKLYHIHTKLHRTTPPFYARSVPQGQYIQLSL